MSGENRVGASVLWQLHDRALRRLGERTAERQPSRFAAFAMVLGGSGAARAGTHSRHRVRPDSRGMKAVSSPTASRSTALELERWWNRCGNALVETGEAPLPRIFPLRGKTVSSVLLAHPAGPACADRQLHNATRYLRLLPREPG